MKHLLYSIAIGTLALTTLGCADVQKLVDEGNYDAAIHTATRKLSGKKNKKTKHVRGLEQAFAKVSARDLDQVAYLKTKGDARSWDAIYELYNTIERRQEKIRPFLPLVSKDGYLANFEMYNTPQLKAMAAGNAAAEHYEDGQRLLSEARDNSDYRTARQAYSSFVRVSNYYRDYKDIDQLRSISKELGTTHVLITIEDQLLNTLSTDYIGKIRNKQWVAYYLNPRDRDEFDLISNLSIIRADITPERELIDRHTETKTIERWVDKVNRRGEVVTDTLGNAIQEKVEETIKARVQHIQRSKSAVILAQADVIEYESRRAIAQEPIEITIDFVSEQIRVRGDRRALSNRFRNRNEGVIEPFPTDLDMLIEGHEKILYAYESIVHDRTY